jgi:hypothetical protein
METVHCILVCAANRNVEVLAAAAAAVMMVVTIEMDAATTTV